MTGASALDITICPDKSKQSRPDLHVLRIFLA